MLRLLSCIVLCVGLAGLAHGQTDATNNSMRRFTIATHNLQNAMDVFDDPYMMDERLGAKPREKLEQVAAALRTLDADVIVFQELEAEGMLRVVTHELLGGMGYEYIAVQPTNTDHGINLGVISRSPIVSITSHRLLELRLPGDERVWRFARDLMRVRVQATPKRTLDLYVAHFKSKRGVPGDPQSASWRMAEASATHRIISRTLTAEPGAWIALAGDLNSTPDSDVIARLQSPPEGRDQPSLINPHANLAPDERVTYLRKPYRSTIDYILVSEALSRLVVPGSAQVITNTDLLGGSDHAPVAVSFDLPMRP